MVGHVRIKSRRRIDSEARCYRSECGAWAMVKMTAILEAVHNDTMRMLWIKQTLALFIALILRNTL